MIIGYVSYGFENQSVAMYKEDNTNGLLVNSLWIDSIASKVVNLDIINNKYCIIIGTFDRKNKGHMGMWSGALKNIERLELWSDPSQTADTTKQ